jgi:MmgE/PrpD N-terminal domain
MWGNPRHIHQQRASGNTMTQPKTNGALNGNSLTVEQRTANLVRFCSELTFKDIPSEVVERTKSFYLDTIACAVAGQEHAAVKAMVSFAKQMGPVDGKCEYWFSPESRTSAAFGALVNGAASHVVEQDDLNNLGMIHSVFHSKRDPINR